MSGSGLGERPQAAFTGTPQGLGADRFEPANRRRLSAPALRTFAALADLWGLNEEQRRLVLGYPSRSTYQNWMKQAREQGEVTLDVDTLTRLSAVFGVHQALGVLHADVPAQLAWLKGPHHAPLFGGQAPMRLITSGSLDGILLVRRFLDAARGGLYMAPNGLDESFPQTSAGDIVWR